MSEEKIFVDGFIFKLPSERAPEFVKGKVSIKCGEFTEFMRKHVKNGWINIDLKISKGGKGYAELDTYEKQESAQTQSPQPSTSGGGFQDDVPF